METDKSKKALFASITGMRGIACLFIMCFHYYCLFFDNPGLGVNAAPFAPDSAFFFLYSKNAVELFFMISGFLIAYHYRDSIAGMSFPVYIRKHYGKLIVPSVIVTLWAAVNAWILPGTVAGSEAYVTPVTPLRFILSILMVNTGWVTSYGQTALPVNTTMWYIDVLLLCYLLYYPIRKLLKNRYVYLSACMLMVLIGWVCLEHSPKLPFMWAITGRGYATFFLGALLNEFQDQAEEKVRKGVSVVWATLILGFLVIRLIIGFENIFGTLGSSSYVRYFEFVAAPGMILCALNLSPVRKCLEWKPLVWLGTLSGVIYYVHNNIMEDYLILDSSLGLHLDFSSGWVFLAVLVSIIPLAVLWQYIEKKLKHRFHLQRSRSSSSAG